MINSFKETFHSEAFKDLVKKALEIKKADKGISGKLKIISIVSCLGMTVLGYFALGGIGAIIFLMISYVASFSLTLSMKKKTLIAYLKHYREKLMPYLAKAEKIDKPDSSDYLNLLYPETLHHWTVCYSSSGTVMGFARIYKGASEIANGMAVCATGRGTEGRIFKGFFPTLAEDYVEEKTSTGFLPEGAEEFAKVLENHFNSYAMLFSDKCSLFFLPDASDFMAGRVEDKNDVSPKALARQFVYCEIAKAFTSLDVEKLIEACTLFECDLSDEDIIYKAMNGEK